MSLLESCLTLAIASTVMAVSTTPLMRSRDAYVLNAAAHDVGARMYAARIHSITRNEDCRLRVSSTTAYVVECENGAWNLVESAELPRGLTISANARPEFHHRGNVSPTGTISVWDSKGGVRRVVVNVNGRVRIQ